jgi:DHA2 family multidrug resistance protein
VRQLGGSIGIAIVVTILTQHIDQARSGLIGNIAMANPIFVQEMRGFTGAFMMHGYSAASGREAALQAINMLVLRQAATIAYEYIFAWIGLLFVACLPLVAVLSGKIPHVHVDKSEPALAE